MTIPQFVTLNESPLFKEINNAIKESKSPVYGIHVSITPAGEWDQHEGDRYWVKWLCWNLFDEKGKCITEPKLCIVHGDLEQNSFKRNLVSIFKMFHCVVDNDITFESEET